jgi:hypothetical protein
MKRHFAPAVAIPIVAVAALLMPAQSRAQDVQYQTVTRLELPGAAGAAMRFAARLGGSSTETVETTYIKGRRMRTDSDGISTIIDLENGRVITLDHVAKTYRSMTLEEMLAAAQQAADALAARPAGDPAAGHGDREAGVKFRLSVDPANERQRIGGQEAERFFITVQADGEYTPEGAEQREQAGTLVVLTDLWSARSGPGYAALTTFNQASAGAFAAQSASIMEGLAAVVAGDPNLTAAFEQSVEHARDMDGLPMRTTTTFVVVAAGEQFDRQALLEPKPEGPGVAQQAGRAALGRLGARAAAAAGRQQEQQEPPGRDQPPATQMTLMTVVSEIRELSARTVDPALFEVPEGYRLVEDGGV